MKSNSTLRNKIWAYLIIFSITILSFLWFFQVIFLNKYYEIVKTAEINRIANKISNNYGKSDFEEILDNISFDSGVCIEIISDNINIYSTSSLERGCINNKLNINIDMVKREFINSKKKSKSYLVKNERFDNKTIIKAIKLDEDYYLFINASLAPLTSTTNILASQLIYVTLIVLFLSFLIAYFISKRISKPIIRINNTAKKMAKGDYNISFETEETIKEIKELTDTLNNTKEELSKTDELRRELMANVSHDLKTPLTMIKAYAEMVRDLTYNNKEKRDNNLNTIIEETDRLNLLVNDILELSKMQTGIIDLKYEKFDLNAVIIDILNKFKYLEETDNYKFIYKNKKALIVNCDKRKIEQVIYNLINNAVNYVGKDKKVIIDTIDNYDNIRVEISDHGKGIDNEEINLIWDKYYKVNKQYKRNTHGTGLGLSIVKNTLVSHGYNYGVNSIKDKGTTFYFEIKK